MPDYKLEIEIDVAKFSRDIKKGVKDSGLDKLLFGGGSSGGTPKGGTDTSAQWDKLSKIMEDFLRELEEQTKLLRDMNTKTKRSVKQIEIQYKADTQAILLKASLNQQFAILRATLVRDNMAAREMGGVFSNIGKMFGGRVGSGIGRILDTKLKYMQPTTEIEEDLAPGRAGGKSAARLGKPLGIPSLTASKTGGLPMPVKIAGFAAMLAGGAGLGKLIIDSSPLLQAMFKIVNTGIMFMLRPIGDMFALLIRPVSIIFLKYAAGFYKDTLKYFPVWDKWGQAIATFLTGHPFEAGGAIKAGFMELDRISTIEDMTKAALEDDETPGVITVEERKAIAEENKIRKEAIKKVMDDMRASIDLNKPIEEKALDLASLFSFPALQANIITRIIDWFTKLADDASKLDEHKDAVGLSVLALLGFAAYAQGAGEQFKVTLDETLKLNSGLTVAVNYLRTMSDSLSISASIITQFEKGSKAEYDFLEILDKMTTSTGGGTGEHVAAAQALALNKIGTDLETQIKVMNTPAPTGSNYANQLFESGGGGQLPEFESFEELEKHFKDMLINGETTAEFSESIAEVWAAMESGDILQIQEAVKRMNNDFQLMSQNSKIGATQLYVGAQYVVATVAKMRSALRAFVRQSDKDAQEKAVLNLLPDTGFLNPECNVVIDEPDLIPHGINIWSGPNKKKPLIDSWTTFKATGLPYLSQRDALCDSYNRIEDYKKQGYAFESYASGGFINEPVFGRGTKTGKGYMFGESGPEKVVPISGTGDTGGGGIQANFYISGVGGDDALSLERKLKPMVLKWLKEEGSRRGIL